MTARAKAAVILVACVIVALALSPQAQADLADVPLIGGAFESVLNAVTGAFAWLWEKIGTAVGDRLEQVTNAVPDLWAEAGGAAVWGAVGPALRTADYWFPVTEMSVIFGVYYGYLTIVMIVKWILKFTPFMG